MIYLTATEVADVTFW